MVIFPPAPLSPSMGGKGDGGGRFVKHPAPRPRRMRLCRGWAGIPRIVTSTIFRASSAGTRGGRKGTMK
eukprot:7330298-Pyramimonas_sp.AAC.1